MRFGARASVDMTNGPILKKLIIYAIPIIIVNVTQTLFHAADVAILGIFASDIAVAAVGATGALITLINSIFIGLSTGANVVMARNVGAKNLESSRKTVGTATLTGVISGFLLMAVVLIFAKTFLLWMKCDASVIDLSARYIRIYYAGMPIIMLYNFLAATLRASGDSVHPMNFMLIAGVINVPLNILFIVAFKLTVEGVAIATVLSQAVALLLLLRVIMKDEEYCKITRETLKIYKDELLLMIKIGVPSGLTGMFYYVANVVVQSAVNTLGPDYMTANAISGQFDAMIYTVGCAVATACMVFVGQNMGAGRIDRIKKVLLAAILAATAISLLLGGTFVLLSDLLLGIMTDSEVIISYAKQRMVLLCLTYFITSIMEVFSFSLRSLGKVSDTVVVGFITGFLGRIAWVKFVWPLKKTLGTLYLVFPISAMVAIAMYIVAMIFALKGLEKKLKPEAEKVATLSESKS